MRKTSEALVEEVEENWWKLSLTPSFHHGFLDLVDDHPDELCKVCHGNWFAEARGVTFAGMMTCDINEDLMMMEIYNMPNKRPYRKTGQHRVPDPPPTQPMPDVCGECHYYNSHSPTCSKNPAKKEDGK